MSQFNQVMSYDHCPEKMGTGLRRRGGEEETREGQRDTNMRVLTTGANRAGPGITTGAQR